MLKLFDKNYHIKGFEALKGKTKEFLYERLRIQHEYTTKSIENYRKFKTNAADLDSIVYFQLDSHEYKYIHSLNVAQYCVKLAEMEGCVSPKLMELAGLLHDVGHFGCNYKEHAVLSARLAADFLRSESEIDAQDIEKISKIISAHYIQGEDYECYFKRPDMSLEEVILMEADLLEKANIKSGMQIFLECGSKKKDLTAAINEFEKRVIVRFEENVVSCRDRKENCCCTDSLFILLEEQLEYNKKFISDLKKYACAGN